MQVFRDLFNLYNSKEDLIKQFTIFSIVGIFAILFCNTYSFLLNAVFDDFYLYLDTNKFCKIFNMCICIGILFFLVGYKYNLVKNFVVMGKISLPEISLRSFYVFFRLFKPLFIWGIYYLFFALVIIKMIFSSSFFIVGVILLIFLIFLFPFVGIILCTSIKYNNNELYCINYIFKIVKKTYKKVIELNVNISLLMLIFGCFIYNYFYVFQKLLTKTWLFGVMYFGIILTFYLLLIASFVYFIGLARITKDEFNLNISE